MHAQFSMIQVLHFNLFTDKQYRDYIQLRIKLIYSYKNCFAQKANHQLLYHQVVSQVNLHSNIIQVLNVVPL